MVVIWDMLEESGIDTLMGCSLSRREESWKKIV
jgi:hypothetical protein